MSESEPFGRSAVPSAGQKRAAVSYSVPQCGHTLSTAMAGWLSLVCWASPPDPSWLVCSGCSSVSDAATGASPDRVGGGDGLVLSGVSDVIGCRVCATTGPA